MARPTESLRLRTCILAALLILASAASARAEDLFLGGGRFRVAASFETAAGPGVGNGVPLSADSGTFWFFSPANVELVVKVVDACAPPFERFWFFAAGLTNVAVEIEVEDTLSGETRRYSNAAGRAFRPIQDTTAFATCGFVRACGQGSAAEIAATPRADPNLEDLALVLSPGITARPATYDRLAADIPAIRAAFPQLAAAEFRPAYDATTLIISLTPEAAAAARAGSYHAWDCLNAWYGSEDVRVLNPTNVAFVRFRGLLRTDRIAPEYLALDGVRGVEQNFLLAPPLPPFTPDRICARAEGARFHYLFETYEPLQTHWYLTTAAPGAEPVLEDQFSYFPITNPVPAFLPQFQSCLDQSGF
jgi:hypothetical protein